VTSIGDGAFNYCTGLTSITIPNSVTSIGEAAFDYCTGLTSVTIGNSVTSIGDGAFFGCTGLISITIPNSVTSIGDDAFGYCPGLTSITIPNSVTSIGDGAFRLCSGLTSVISLIEEPFEINENTFYNWVKDHEEFTTATLYVPTGTKAKYESTPAWNKFANIVEGIENAVKSVETDAKAEETERYNVSGQRISSPQKGLNIVKMSDGTTRKIMCK
ncbi:MAG: leucine-rich repeat domain-containing protein, partial [Prevotella sp.]|nr:leucine-rich repeat domain-containing protein [Prevotella sp.]